MNLELTYVTSCQCTVVETNGDMWMYINRFGSLKDAVEWAQFQIDARPIDFRIDCIRISSCETGELLAECTPEISENSSDEEYEDWDYNEDMGYDPYLGCYTDDC